MATYQVFEGLNKSEINRIVDSGLIRPIEGGTLLFRKGDVGHEMYVILTGQVDIIDDYDTDRDVIAELGPGEIIGEMAMFEKEGTRSAHALVKEPSQLLVLSEEKLNKLLDKKIARRFLANIIGVLCHRLRITNSMYMCAKYAEKRVRKKWQSVLGI